MLYSHDTHEEKILFLQEDKFSRKSKLKRSIRYGRQETVYNKIVSKNVVTNIYTYYMQIADVRDYPCIRIGVFDVLNAEWKEFIVQLCTNTSNSNIYGEILRQFAGESGVLTMYSISKVDGQLNWKKIRYRIRLSLVQQFIGMK